MQYGVDRGTRAFQPSSLLQCVASHAEERPDAPALSFLNERVEVVRSLSYSQLLESVRGISATVLGHAPAEGRALLLYTPGLDFTLALMACWQSGIVAVPVAVPGRGASGLPVAKLRAIAHHSRAVAILCNAAVYARRAELGEVAPELRSLTWIVTDAPDANASDGPTEARPANGVAFVQYTSGSTASPKGVLVTHANILHNQQALRRHFAQDARKVVVSWLPPYHDMGLIGCILNPLFVGAHAYLMSATTFLKRPERWLMAISRYRATTAAAPDFAYEFCAREVSDEQKASLDLSSWRVAISGGERVRGETLRAFTRAFAACGFRSDAFRPSYGLAESTLMVSASKEAGGLGGVEFDRAALSLGQVIFDPSSAETVELVSCGTWSADSTLKIIDPDTLAEAASDRIGEVWVRSPSVARGYETAEASASENFRGFTAGGEGPFLRTGDLGFVFRGELFIAGRLKDLIIVGGQNIHPEDIEQLVEGLDPAIGRPCAVFSSEHLEGERLSVVCEVSRQSHAFEALEALEALEHLVREQVYRRSQLPVQRVVLVNPGTIPKTSSGKVRRSACRDLVNSGSIRDRRESLS